MKRNFQGGRLLSNFGAQWFLLLIVFLLVTGCSGEAGDPTLYRTFCATCHGPDGEGLRALYPALTGSKYLDEQLDQLPCLIVNGAGNTVVMPGFPQLEIAEITGLITYLNSRWAPTPMTVSEEQVTAWLKSCP